MATTPTRSRGGQPGNLNAVKHGFYARIFTLTDERDLENIEVVNYTDEIDLLRVLIRRLARSSAELTDPLELSCILRVLTLATSSLSRLVTAQKYNTPQEDIGAAVREAVRNSMGDLPLLKYLREHNNPPPSPAEDSDDLEEDSDESDDPDDIVCSFTPEK